MLSRLPYNYPTGLLRTRASAQTGRHKTSRISSPRRPQQYSAFMRVQVALRAVPRTWLSRRVLCSAANGDGHQLSTHVSSDGSTPKMVDVGDKATTRRTATARSRVRLPPDVTSKMNKVGGEVVGKKGPVFTTAIVAGVQAAKRTSGLIPFCHPLPIEDCRVELSLKEGGAVVEVDCTVRVTHKTGVEMEAMVGASVAALTVYDMLKGLSHDIVIEETALLSKAGGKRDFSKTGQSTEGGKYSS